MRLKLKDVEFSYSSVKVLDDVCLDLDEPKFVCVLGPNGVGKSTLVHCINRILKPQKGVVLLDQANVQEMGLKEVARKVGYVPQASTDMFPLTVVDTVLMGRHPHSGWNTSERDLDIVTGILGVLGIDDLALRSFDELSAGQKQKVLIARGLAQEPQLLLLDEPTSNLDIRHQLEVMELLGDLVRSRDLMVVMVSHDLNITARYAHLVIMMKGGRIFAVGTPEQVFTEENIRSVYGVEAQVVTTGAKPYVVPLAACKAPMAGEGSDLVRVEGMAPVGHAEPALPSDMSP